MKSLPSDNTRNVLLRAQLRCLRLDLKYTEGVALRTLQLEPRQAVQSVDWYLEGRRNGLYRLERVRFERHTQYMSNNEERAAAQSDPMDNESIVPDTQFEHKSTESPW